MHQFPPPEHEKKVSGIMKRSNGRRHSGWLADASRSIYHKAKKFFLFRYVARLSPLLESTNKAPIFVPQSRARRLSLAQGGLGGSGCGPPPMLLGSASLGGGLGAAAAGAANHLYLSRTPPVLGGSGGVGPAALLMGGGGGGGAGTARKDSAGIT